MTSDARRTLRVDPLAVAEAMESPENAFRSYLDLQTGEVLIVSLDRMSFDSPDPVEQHIEDDPDRYAAIPQVESREEYERMRAFAEESIADRRLRARALEALRGKGAFARFKDTIGQDAAVRDAWYAHRDEWLLREAMRWLHEIGIEPEVALPSRVPIPPEAPAAGPPTARLELVHVLLLGGANGAGDVVDGSVRRRIRTRRADDARAVFQRLARDLCELRGIPWRDQLIDRETTLVIEDIRLDVIGDDVEVTVRIPDDVARAFARENG